MNIQFEGDKVILDKVDFIKLMGGDITPIQVIAKGPSLNVENDITEYLDGNGFKRHLKGFNFLRIAILKCMEDPSIMSRVTKELYPYVAASADTTSSKVERAIRHSIEITFPIFEKPTNSEFIALVADVIRLKREI